jgi:hypothetical protein
LLLRAQQLNAAQLGAWAWDKLLDAGVRKIIHQRRCAVLLGTKHRLMLLCMQIVGKSVAHENAVES